MYLEYLYILLFAIIFVFICWVIGKKIMNTFFATYSSGIAGLFLGTTFGITSVLFLYSMVITYGKTINLGIVIVFL
jgi:ABC-type amino acid transport system permease subunit